jgi:hypothetical protein
MSEPESLRQIAARLIQEHREKKRNSLSAFLDKVPPDVLGAVSVLQDRRIEFTAGDLDWMKRCGIEL